MISLYTSEQVRHMDQQAIAGGISGYALMQRAAAAVLHGIGQRWPQGRSLLIVCGHGNNAGDGYEVARQALSGDWQVKIFYLKAPQDLAGDAAIAADAAMAAGADCEAFSIKAFEHWCETMAPRHTILVDAVLGTGIRGGLRADHASAIAAINNAPWPVLAIDVPSGLNADTGFVETLAVQADVTLSVIARKQGLYTGDAPAFTGELLFDDLGLSSASLPPSFSPSARAIDASVLDHPGLVRRRTAHKGDSGHVLLVGGDTGFGGAAIMAAEAAARSGAGTVSLITRSAHVTGMLTRCPEVMVHGIDSWCGVDAERALLLLRKATAIVIGPGLGHSDWSNDLLKNTLELAARLQTPLVIDADALNLLAAQNKDWETLALAAQRTQWIITPHPGEAARLLACETTEISRDRFAAIKSLQQKTGAVCILKGAGSLLAFPDQALPVDICLEGNPGMASGGMGDVLAGICGAMLALGLKSSGFDASTAARLAVCAHGEAADQAAANLGQRGLLASDLLIRLPLLLSGSGNAGRIQD